MTVNNFLCILFLSALVSVVYGFTLEDVRAKRQADGMVPTTEECLKPPMKKNVQECCKLPRERIFGDMRHSLKRCFKKVEHGRKTMRQEMADDGDDMSTMMPPEGAGPASEAEMPSESTTPSGSNVPEQRPERPHRKKHHRNRQHPNDECFMECVFEEQGFLLGGKVHKEALIQRLHRSLARNEMWRKVAIGAVETCHQSNIALPSNSTCLSGSGGMFRCIFKQIFFNCPSWPEKNEYCTSLREFYQKCPDGPPPEMDDRHPPPPPPTEESEQTESVTSEEPTSEE